MLRKVLICLANAIVLVLLHLMYFNSTWNLSMESEMVLKMTKMENFFAGNGNYNPEDFLFINTANDNMLIESTDENLPGNEVITDRRKLATLFKKIADHKNPHHYILCDILFDLHSPSDSQLAVQINRITKIIIPSRYDYISQKHILPIFNQNQALADYITYDGKVSKMMLWSKDVCEKTLPLKIYEDLSNRVSIKKWPGLWTSGSYIPYNIYPRYYFRESSINRQLIGLGTLIDSLEKFPSSIKQLITNKFLVIGNFSTDSHPTAIGFMPGSLILLNTFLTLKDGYHSHHIGWFLFTLLCFAGITYYKLFTESKYAEKKQVSMLRNLLKLSAIALMLSLASFFLFNIHTTVIPVVLYFQGIQFFSKYFKPS